MSLNSYDYESEAVYTDAPKMVVAEVSLTAFECTRIEAALEQRYEELVQATEWHRERGREIDADVIAAEAKLYLAALTKISNARRGFGHNAHAEEM